MASMSYCGSVPRQGKGSARGLLLLCQARAWAQANLNLLSAGVGPAMNF